MHETVNLRPATKKNRKQVIWIAVFMGRCLISKAENVRPRTECRRNASLLWFALMHIDYMLYTMVWSCPQTKYTYKPVNDRLFCHSRNPVAIYIDIYPSKLRYTRIKTFTENFNGFLFRIEILTIIRLAT